ncbi:DNA-binding transcriptional regulator, AcrR family [Halopseudomonas sabulinigri]|uniref:DNA-binding transcriptional regulator, AcrR family n=1 Tax=Halopseudomonas sabulinigri TaxID=472181 RepID=A0A1H1TK78_9GAMM|nr:TetR/AcrR family transcriptional regulator [Halopseudomonas sabulinigri]SDS59919.1 DNA-binding transcriptional regulator, AcrR family [Halopseudomonas sabulinigri]
MRYSEDHKAKTHQLILEEASRRFRRDGVGATGLQPLMKALGLTHGGFYAHFKSKDELVEKALQHATSNLRASLAMHLGPDAPASALIDTYLTPEHRSNPDRGCPLPTMSAELGQRGQASATTDQVVNDRLANLADKLDGDDAEDKSVLVLSALVGALLLSRSVSDEALSDHLLNSAREQLNKLVEAPAD